MKRLLTSFALALLLFAARLGAEEVGREEVLNLLRKAAAQYEQGLRFDYRVLLRCPEIEGIVAERLAFFPVPVQPQVELLNEGGLQTLRPVLPGGTEPLQAMVEQLCRSSPRFYTLLGFAERSHAWPSFFRTIPDTVPIDLIHVDEQTVEFEISGLAEPFQQQIVRSCRITLHRPTALFAVTTLECGQHRTVSVTWNFREVRPPDGQQALPLPDRVDIRQNVFIGGKQPVPEKFSLVFGEYRFLSAAESAAKAAARAEAEAKLNKLRAALRSLGLPESNLAQIRYRREGTLELDLRGLPVDDLSFLSGLPVCALAVNTGKVDTVWALTNMPLARLDLVCVPVHDLRPLHGLPLTELRLWNTGVSNLAPLAGMPLAKLDIGNCPVSDLSPLRGMPLRDFSASYTAVSDLSPLAGMSLEHLRVWDCGNRLADISALRGMTSLKRANFAGARNLRDLHPLEGCANLEELTLPPLARDIEFLRQLPKLKRLSHQKSRTSWSPDSTAEEFWKYDAENQKLRAGLRASGASSEEAEQASLARSDGQLELDLANAHVTNIVFLAGVPVRRLLLRNSKVTDISPLRGSPLEYLSLTGSPVSDVSPLAECPHLSWLSLSGTRVADVQPVLRLPLTHLSVNGGLIRDVSPLAACVTLETLHLPEHPTGVEALRSLPHLKRVSCRWDAKNAQPAQTAEAFWKEQGDKTDSGGGKER